MNAKKRSFCKLSCGECSLHGDDLFGFWMTGQPAAPARSAGIVRIGRTIMSSTECARRFREGPKTKRSPLDAELVSRHRRPGGWNTLAAQRR